MSWRERHLAAIHELETAASAVMLGALNEILDDVQGKFAAVVAAAGDPDEPVPPAEPTASLDDLAKIQAQWVAAVDGTVIPWFGEVFEAGGIGAVEQVAEVTGRVVPDVEPQFMNEAAARHLATARNRFLTVGEDTWDRTRASLLEGFQAGEGIDPLRKRVQEAAGLSRATAEAVARTEVISAANGGSMARVRLMGADAPPYKQWLATMDRRTRPAHAAADNQVVARDEPFEVGVARLDVPGDPAGPADEVINCRCTVLFIDDPEPLEELGRQQGGITEEVAPLVAGAGRPVAFAESDPGSSMVIVAEAPAAHMAGKHNQKSHGKGGSGGSEGSGGGGGGAKGGKAAGGAAGGGAADGGEFSPEEFQTESGGFSVRDAKAYQKVGWSEWAGDITPQQRRVVEDYAGDTTFSHFAMNAYLRGIPGRGGRPVPKRSVERKIANMDGAFEHASAKMPTDAVVHRGITGPFAARLIETHRQGRLRTSAGGARIRDRGFVSTSLDKRQASVFAREGARGERVSVEYRLRRGQPAIAPAAAGGLGARHASELEVILPRGQTYEVVAASTDSRGILNIAVEVVDGG